jgi:hypothetical protein
MCSDEFLRGPQLCAVWPWGQEKIKLDGLLGYFCTRRYDRCLSICFSFFFSLRLEVWNVPGCDMRFPLVPLSWPSEMGKMQYANASTEGLVRIL